MGVAATETDELSTAFPFLTDPEREQLLPFLESRQWQAGEVVMAGDELPDVMGFLASGKLAVKKETGFPGRFILLALLESGSMVAEHAMVDPGPRKALLVAMEDSRLLLLSRTNLERIALAHPSLALKIFRRIILVLGHRLRGASERLARLL